MIARRRRAEASLLNAPAKLMSGGRLVRRTMTSEKLSVSDFCDRSRRYASSVIVNVFTDTYV